MIVRFSRHGADDNSPYAQEPCEVESLKHGFVAEVRRETVSPTVTGRVRFEQDVLTKNSQNIQSRCMSMLPALSMLLNKFGRLKREPTFRAKIILIKFFL